MERVTASPIRASQKPIIIVTLILIFGFYFIFMFFPIGYSMVGSFFDWNPTIGRFNYLGIDNYKDIFSSTIFWESLLKTFYFTVIVVFFRNIIGLGIALMIFRIKKFKSFFRTVYFLPVISSIVAVSLVWKWLYEPSTGLFNYVLTTAGLPELGWLKDARLALPSIMIMTIWKDIGYPVVIYLAGLGGIPSTYFEAAKIDGASSIKVFTKITFPLLQPTTLFILVTSVIAYLQTFTQIFVMTENNSGGPGTACNTTVFMLYEEAFIDYDFGTASAISFVLFLIILIISIIQLKLIRTDWRY